MKNFRHLPEPFRIRIIESVKRTTCAYREEAIIKSGIDPSLLDSEGAFIDLLTDSGIGAVTQNMQVAVMRGDEAYNGNRSYYALAESVKNILGYQHTVPTHRDRGVEQIYILVLIKKCEQEKGLDRSKTAVPSNYFPNTTQGHSQINGYIVRGVHIKETFDIGVRYDFKDNFDLKGLEHGIEEVGPNSVLYIVATITSNSVGGQPVSLANLKAIYSVAKKYDISAVMDSARLAENAYFIKQRETEYKNWITERVIRETYKYVDILAMSAKKDAMVSMGGLLCMKDDGFFDVYTECRTFCVVQEGFLTYGGLEGGAAERLVVGLYDGMNLDWLVYHTAQVQYLINGLEEVGVVCQQAGGHVAFADVGKLLLHIPVGQFPAQALACEPYKIAGTRTIEIGSFLSGRDPKTGKQLSCPAGLLRLTTPRTTHIQIHMDFIAEAFKHVKENTANVKGLTSTYEPKVLRYFIAKLREA